MSIIYVLLAIVLLGVIVTVHELGHYTVGRLCGIGIEEFSVGFGPKILGRVSEKTGIQYSLRAIPLGGYCLFVGEDEENPTENAFNNQSVWKRFATILAGPVMNFVLALVVTLLVVGFFGIEDNYPIVGDLIAGTPAAESGLLPGDVIYAVDGQTIEYAPEGLSQLSEVLAVHEVTAPIEMTVERGGERVTYSFLPAIDEATGNAMIGIYLGSDRVPMNASGVLSFSISYIGMTMRDMVNALVAMVTTGSGLDQTMGPVGIVAFMGQNMQRGVDFTMQLVIIISMNLGIMNLLPLPALDGGRLVFLLFEGIFRRPVPRKFEGLVHAIGLVALLALIAVFSFRDIRNLF